MKLQDQICSLELAKRLKALGITQDSLFYYQNQPYNDGTDDIVIKIKESDEIQILNLYHCTNEHEFFSAFTSTELAEKLPRTLKWPDGTYALQEDFYSDGSYSIYYTFNNYAPIDFSDEKRSRRPSQNADLSFRERLRSLINSPRFRE